MEGSHDISTQSSCEEFQIMAGDLKDLEQISEIYNNPAVRILTSALGLAFPSFAGAADDAVKRALVSFQKKKEAQLFELIFADDTIALDDVQNVTVIMEFARLLNVSRRLARNTKLKYLSNLMRSSIQEIKTGQIDEFEENLEKLDNLSEREMLLLELLYQAEQEVQVTADGKARFNRSKSWKAFLEKVKGAPFHYNESDAIAAMMSVARTGFCIMEFMPVLDAKAVFSAYISPSYREFRRRIFDGV